MFKPAELFESTNDTSYNENRKAQIKNHNLPILRYMYMGDPTTEICCMIDGSPAFVEVPDYVTGKPKRRFRLDFNHIRQEMTERVNAGMSKDKGRRLPSGLFREVRFDSADHRLAWTIEFMTIMPVSTEQHSYISQDSSLGNITLKSFPKFTWPWVLKSEKNFQKFCRDLKISGLDYSEFIDHLSDIHHDPLHLRLRYDWRTNEFSLI